jgi:hypothetical protein
VRYTSPSVRDEPSGRESVTPERVEAGPLIAYWEDPNDVAHSPSIMSVTGRFGNGVTDSAIEGSAASGCRE